MYNICSYYLRKSDTLAIYQFSSYHFSLFACMLNSWCHGTHCSVALSLFCLFHSSIMIESLFLSRNSLSDSCSCVVCCRGPQSLLLCLSVCITLSGGRTPPARMTDSNHKKRYVVEHLMGELEVLCARQRKTDTTAIKGAIETMSQRVLRGTRSCLSIRCDAVQSLQHVFLSVKVSLMWNNWKNVWNELNLLC